MGYWKKQHNLRGSFLEECINTSNNYYFENGLAVVQKIPTPITPVELDNGTGQIRLAYFDKQSTVDYIGNVQGIPICFDAKETKLEYLPLENIKKHQINFMEQYNNQDGLSFLIINYLKYDKIYLCPWETLKRIWDDSKQGGRKSIPISEMKERYLIRRSGNILVHYLEALNNYLQDKIQEENNG